MDDCTICSEPLAVPGASLTKCGHVFHTSCLERWFDQKPLCPLCKTKVTRRDVEDDEFVAALVWKYRRIVTAANAA